MRVKFIKDVDHNHSPRALTAYKTNVEYAVPSEFGEACIADGSATEVKGRKRKALKPPEDQTEGSDDADGNGS